MSRTAGLPDQPWYVDTYHDRDWTLDAACRGLDPELWFPHRSTHRRERRDNTRLAQRICGECPVQTDCLRHAIVTDTRYGIWGGATEADRARLTGRRVAG